MQAKCPLALTATSSHHQPCLSLWCGCGPPYNSQGHQTAALPAFELLPFSEPDVDAHADADTGDHLRPTFCCSHASTNAELLGNHSSDVGISFHCLGHIVTLLTTLSSILGVHFFLRMSSFP